MRLRGAGSTTLIKILFGTRPSFLPSIPCPDTGCPRCSSPWGRPPPGWGVMGKGPITGSLFYPRTIALFCPHKPNAHSIDPTRFSHAFTTIAPWEVVVKNPYSRFFHEHVPELELSEYISTDLQSAESVHLDPALAAGAVVRGRDRCRNGHGSNLGQVQCVFSGLLPELQVLRKEAL